MQTGTYWLNTIPSGYKELALSNASSQGIVVTIMVNDNAVELPVLDVEYDSAYRAIRACFRWDITAEGYGFWEQVAIAIATTNKPNPTPFPAIP